MPAKMARFAARPPLGSSELRVAVGPRDYLVERLEKHQYSRQFGSHLGNPGSRSTRPLHGSHGAAGYLLGRASKLASAARADKVQVRSAPCVGFVSLRIAAAMEPVLAR